MKFSVIIPVYDEGPAAAAAVRAVRGLRGGAEAELILSCAGPDAEALNPAEMPGVAFVKSPAGRAEQMNLGAQKASGEVLVFLHADTRLPAGAFQAMERALVPGGRCGGAFRLEIASRNPWLRFVAWTANVRNRFTGTPYGDQAIFMRSGFFRRLGGYARIPIMEDVDLVRRARGAGGRLVILREAAATSPRRWEKEGMLRTTLNHHALRLLYLGGVSAEKLAGFRAARGFAAKAACLFGRKARAGKEALVLFARYPFEGAVKTRLAAGLGERRTRGLYACFLRDAADELRRLKADIFVSFTPARAGREFREFLGADFNYLPQICGTLGERMENALREVFQKGVSRAVIVGSDLPGLTAGRINEAFSLLAQVPAVIGPSEDGGYYLLGLREEAFTKELFSGIRWSSPYVFEQTMERFGRRNISPAVLGRLRDIDDLPALRRFYYENAGEATAPATMEFIKGELAGLIPYETAAKIFIPFLPLGGRPPEAGSSVHPRAGSAVRAPGWQRCSR